MSKITIQSVEAYYQHNRDSYAAPFRLRIHRAVSWLNKAAKAAADEDLDFRFISLWIAFNAAYAKEVQCGQPLPERGSFRQFLQMICRLDKAQSIYTLVWQTWSDSIRVLLDNQYIFQKFWDYQNGLITEESWQEDFSKSKQKIHQALANKDTELVLSIIFDRLYTLRNQIMHGGATYNSSANRDQLRDGSNILEHCILLILLIMQQNHDHAYSDWGQPFYPYINQQQNR